MIFMSLINQRLSMDEYKRVNPALSKGSIRNSFRDTITVMDDADELAKNNTRRHFA